MKIKTTFANSQLYCMIFRHAGLFILSRRESKILGSLSKGVFERRTATGNETFSLFTRLGATIFVILSVFTLIEKIYLKIRAHPLLKNEKRLLPVAVRRSKTPLLKLPSPFFGDDRLLKLSSPII